MNSFDRWWSEEGSAMRPMPTEDVEEFAKRIAMTAWSNGAYIFAKQPEPVPGAFNPGNFDVIAAIATQPAAQPQQEPFGYFRADAFGWTDCAETDENAKALYEYPFAKERNT